MSFKTETLKLFSDTIFEYISKEVLYDQEHCLLDLINYLTIVQFSNFRNFLTQSNIIYKYIIDDDDYIIDIDNIDYTPVDFKKINEIIDDDNDSKLIHAMSCLYILYYINHEKLDIIDLNDYFKLFSEYIINKNIFF